MSGTIFGVGMSQWFDPRTKEIAIGAKLYLYEANSSTPVTAYKDFGLSAGQDHPFPIESDTYGIIPAFWLADGNYRARLTTEDGAIVLFDQQNVQALGPSSGEGGGGGGVSDDQISTTGHFEWQPVSGTRSGWVRANGRTIGSATSSATERANADTQPAFEFLWNNFSDTLCPVSTGRGLSASADFGANKNIGTLDMQGVGAIGLAAMGGSDAGRLDNVTFSVGNKTTAASLCGEALHTLTTGESGQKAISAAPVTITDPGHTHPLSSTVFTPPGAGPNLTGGTGSANTVTATSNTTGISAALTLAGSSAVSAHNNMQPSRTGTWYIKL